MARRDLDDSSDQAVAPVSGPLLVSKLRPPTLGRGIVPRRRLLSVLREGFVGPLTLVNAPAGYGKTTALVGAFAGYIGPHGWLTLDQHDNDLPTFIEYAVGAVRLTFPDAGHATLSLLRQPRPPSLDLLARILANELAALPHGYVLALDEFDVIQDPLIFAFLDALLRYPTAELHLVIASRELPALTLGRMRSRGLLTEIDARLLRFTHEETRAFLEHALGVGIHPEAVIAVDERVEGWPAGLRLVTLSISDQPDPARLTDALADESLSMAQALLWEEVLSRQSVEAQAFFMRTALFERVCVSLIAAALPPVLTRDARHLLEQFARASMFVVALNEDEHGIWYRYHGLFRAALHQQARVRISPQERVAIHTRASAWFAEHGFIEEAVDQSLQAGATEAAANLVEAQAAEAFNREQWPRVERWLAQLPPAVVEARPGLLIARAWIAQLRAQTDGIRALIDAADARLAASAADDWHSRALLGQIDTLRGGAFILAGEAERGLSVVRSGLERLPLEYVYARRVAIAYRSIATQALGEGDATRRMLEAEPADFEHDLVYAEGLSFGVAYHHLAEGALHPADEIMTMLLRKAQTQGFGLSIAWAHFLLGRISYEWDDVPTALAHFRAVLERRDQAHFLPLQGSMFGFALALAAQGEYRLARDHLQSLMETAMQAWSPAHLRSLRSLLARLALREGDVATALRWSAPAAMPAFIPVFAVEDAALTRAWALWATGDRTSVGAAEVELARLADAYAAWRDTLHLVPALALAALTLRAQGERERALDVLADAVRLGTPGRMARSFLDFGMPMARLVGELAARGEGGEHLGRLELAFSHRFATDGRAPRRVDALIEPLTPRETEVLKLLRRRLADREIADILHISRETVHTHTRNIYQKLQVERRQDAVGAGLRLGLIANE